MRYESSVSRAQSNAYLGWELIAGKAKMYGKVMGLKQSSMV